MKVEIGQIWTDGNFKFSVLDITKKDLVILSLIGRSSGRIVSKEALYENYELVGNTTGLYMPGKGDFQQYI